MLVAKKVLPQLPNVGHIPLRDLSIDDIWRQNVRSAMKKQGVGQRYLADHVGCAQGNISQVIDTKRGQARSIHAQRISVALKVPMSWLAVGELAMQKLNRANPKLAQAQIKAFAELADAIDPD